MLSVNAVSASWSIPANGAARESGSSCRAASPRGEVGHAGLPVVIPHEQFQRKIECGERASSHDRLVRQRAAEDDDQVSRSARPTSRAAARWSIPGKAVMSRLALSVVSRSTVSATGYELAFAVYSGLGSLFARPCRVVVGRRRQRVGAERVWLKVLQLHNRILNDDPIKTYL